MRTWDKIDITDILLSHHKELAEASIELSEGGDYEGTSELDDKCIVIEQYLETNHNIIWNGVEFIKEITWT